jgi:hypothetical protein
MAKLTFYSKPNCCLCDHGYPLVAGLATRHGLTLEKVNIENDPQLALRHGQRIPVVELDGRELGWGRLSERALERKLEKFVGATPSGGGKPPGRV